MKATVSFIAQVNPRNYQHPIWLKSIISCNSIKKLAATVRINLSNLEL